MSKADQVPHDTGLIATREEAEELPIAATVTVKAPKRGRPFAPGKSGNPRGRPQGSRNRTTVAIEALLEGEAEELTRKVIEKAKQGDMAALRLCLERIAPVRRDRPIMIDLPQITSISDGLVASRAVLTACAGGLLTPSEAREVMDLLYQHIKTVEIEDIVKRLAALEKAQR